MVIYRVPKSLESRMAKISFFKLEDSVQLEVGIIKQMISKSSIRKSGVLKKSLTLSEGKIKVVLVHKNKS